GHGNRVGGAGPVVRAPGGPRGTFFPSAPGPVFGQRVIARFQPIRPLPGFVFPQPYVTYSPYSVIAPPFYTAPPYVAPTYLAPSYDTPSVTQNDLDLTYEVQRLSREIEQLRQQQALAAAQQAVIIPPPPPEPERPVVPTVLVFRDGSRRTIL